MPPPWISGKFPRTNKTYTFKIIPGDGSSLVKARRSASQELINELATSQGIFIEGTQQLDMSSKQRGNYYQDRYDQRTNISIKTDGFHTRFEIADQYQDDRGQWWILFEVAKDPEKTAFETLTYTHWYGMKGLVRSMLIPGWGQLHKRNIWRGISIMLLQTGTIAGAWVFEDIRKQYAQRAIEQSVAVPTDQYQKLASDYKTLRNACLIAAVAVYGYNLIDAVATPGAVKRYKLLASPAQLSLYIRP